MSFWLARAGRPGGLRPDSGAGALAADDRGVLYGDGAFETMLWQRGRAPLLGRHLARLRAGLHVLGFAALPWSDAALARAVGRVCGANLAQSGFVRLTVTRGSGGRGFESTGTTAPTLLIQAGPLPPAAGAPWRLVTSPWPVNEHSPLCQVKSISAAEKVLAKTAARERGADEAILLNLAGQVAEGTSTNLFVVSGGRLRTPPLHCGALPGIMRALVLELARSAGLPCAEQPFTLAAALEAEEVLLTNALRGVIGVRAWDGRAWPDAGPVTSRLRQLVAAFLDQPAPGTAMG